MDALPSVSELIDPRRRIRDQMVAFYAKGQSPSSAPASRPTVNGLTTSRDSVRSFLDLVTRMEDVRRILVDGMERQEIRSRILERDTRIRVPKLG